MLSSARYKVNPETAGQISRRDFMTRISLAGLACAELTACAGTPRYLGVAEGGVLALNRAEIEALLGEHSAIVVSAPGWEEPLVLSRDPDGAFQAVGSKCTHMGCQVRPGGRFLTCPCHGSTFDLEGHVVRGPAVRALAQYRVSETSNALEVNAL